MSSQKVTGLIRNLPWVKNLFKSRNVKELKLRLQSDTSTEVEKAVAKFATKQGITDKYQLNHSLDDKAKLLRRCEEHFKREIPSYQLRYIRNLEDIVKFYLSPIPKDYPSALPNLEQAIIDKAAPATIRICPDVPRPNPAEADLKTKSKKFYRKRADE